MSDTANELKRRVAKRMAPIEKQTGQDYEEAWAKLSEAEKKEPDAIGRVSRLVAEIELRRAEDRLERIERLVEVLKGAPDELQNALATMYVRRREKAFKEATEMIELMSYEMWGQSYIDDIAKRIVKERRDEMMKKYKRGNGHG